MYSADRPMADSTSAKSASSRPNLGCAIFGGSIWVVPCRESMRSKVPQILSILPVTDGVDQKKMPRRDDVTRCAGRPIHLTISFDARKLDRLSEPQPLRRPLLRRWPE